MHRSWHSRLLLLLFICVASVVFGGCLVDTTAFFRFWLPVHLNHLWLHFLAFFAFSVCLALVFLIILELDSTRSILCTTLSGLLFGILTETAQSFVKRTPSFEDVLYDVFGSFSGALVSVFIWRSLQRLLLRPWVSQRSALEVVSQRSALEVV